MPWRKVEQNKRGERLRRGWEFLQTDVSGKASLIGDV